MKLGHCELIGCWDMLILVLKHIFDFYKVILRSRSNLRSRMETARNIDTISIWNFSNRSYIKLLHVNRKCDLENRKWWPKDLTYQKICLCAKLGHCALIGCSDILILVIKYIFDLHRSFEGQSRIQGHGWKDLEE